ncbi:hypothetical protein M426DRAFT_219793 [Hypoxylon sp. CI-4A]|nr:hypothetical protein M426DRAFT_219793 [Hypoxylon sp. CI-4A]
MAHTPDRGAAKMLAKGQAHYMRHEYDLAEKILPDTMNHCKCGIVVQDQPRVDDVLMAAFTYQGFACTHTRLKNALKKLSSPFRRCDNKVHLEALDALIATYEKQKRLNEALEYAFKMVNLAPREPMVTSFQYRLDRIPC